MPLNLTTPWYTEALHVKFLDQHSECRMAKVTRPQHAQDASQC